VLMGEVPAVCGSGVDRFAGEPVWLFREWQALCASPRARRLCDSWVRADDRIPLGGPAAIMASLTDTASGWASSDRVMAGLRDVGSPEAYAIVTRALFPRAVAVASRYWPGHRWARSLWCDFEHYVEEWVIQTQVWVPRVAQRRFTDGEFLARAVLLDVRREVDRLVARQQRQRQHEVLADPLGELARLAPVGGSVEQDYDGSLDRCADLAGWLEHSVGLAGRDAQVLVATRAFGLPLTQLSGVNPRSVGRQRARNEEKVREFCRTT